MKSVKALTYAHFREPSFREPIHQYYGNLPCGILTLDWVWVTYLINNTFKIKVIFHHYDEVDGDHYIRTAKPTCNHFKGPLGTITIYCTKDTFKDFTQMLSNFICMPLKRYFKSQFSQVNCPILTLEYSANTFSSSTKGIGGHCHDQVFYIKKFFFVNTYVMSKSPLVCIYTLTFLAKYVHGRYSAYEVAFETIPDII